MARPTPLSVMPKPGVFKAATSFASAGRWWDANLVRFRGPQLQPVGGWQAVTDAELPSAGRDELCWHDLNGDPWMAFGTHDGLFAYDVNLGVLHDITPVGVGPLEEPGPFSGFGLGLFGMGLYGTAREPGTVLPGSVTQLYGDIWSMDTYGADLMIVPTQDGHLYRWSPATPATLPAIVAGAPTGIVGGVLVTSERHVVVLGAEADNRRIDFSDQEDPTVWGATPSNMAGTLRLETEGKPLNLRKATGGYLVFTSNDVHLLKYAGFPYGYGVSRVGENCGLLSRRGLSGSGSSALWVSPQCLWQWNGSVLPLLTEVSDFMFSTMNREMVGRVFAFPNSGFTEHWIFYPSEGSLENDRYIALDYTHPDRAASVGALGRTCGDPHGAFLRPVLGASDGKVYLHEYGWTANGASRVGQVYAETGDIMLGEGEARYHVAGINHDFSGPTNRIGFRFKTWEKPDGPTQDTGVLAVVNATGRIDTRFSCRGMRMRIEQTSDGPWALGRTQLLQRIGGPR